MGLLWKLLMITGVKPATYMNGPYVRLYTLSIDYFLGAETPVLISTLQHKISPQHAMQLTTLLIRACVIVPKYAGTGGHLIA